MSSAVNSASSGLLNKRLISGRFFDSKVGGMILMADDGAARNAFAAAGRLDRETESRRQLA
jgi:hypothetical protein